MPIPVDWSLLVTPSAAEEDQGSNRILAIEVEGPLEGSSGQEHLFKARVPSGFVEFKVVSEVGSNGERGWTVEIEGVPPPGVVHAHPWMSVEAARDAAAEVVEDLAALENMQRKEQTRTDPRLAEETPEHLGNEHVEIRTPDDDEMTVMVDTLNAANPPDEAITLEQARAYRTWVGPHANELSLLAIAEGQPAGCARVAHNPSDPIGRYSMIVGVRPEHRRKGIGRKLYARLHAHADHQGASELGIRVHQSNLSLAERWLAQERFVEVERMRKSELDLRRLDENVLNEAEERIRQQGLELTTLGEQDSAETRMKLWKLSDLAERDIPSVGQREAQTFEEFEKLLAQEGCLRSNLVIARDGNTLVGFTILARQSDDKASTWMTGVHPDYRNRGIAFAVKARSARVARDRGFIVMRTNNHLANEPMLAVNKRLGYQPLPEQIVFVKHLKDAS